MTYAEWPFFFAHLCGEMHFNFCSRELHPGLEPNRRAMATPRPKRPRDKPKRRAPATVRRAHPRTFTRPGGIFAKLLNPEKCLFYFAKRQVSVSGCAAMVAGREDHFKKYRFVHAKPLLFSRTPCCKSSRAIWKISELILVQAPGQPSAGQLP